MIIVQLSDLHLRADGRYPRHDAGDTLATAVAVINRMRPRPDAVLFTGDILDRSTRDYGLVRPALDRLDVPLLALPGNHDDGEAFRRAFADMPACAPGTSDFAYTCPDGLVIGLDSNGPDGSAAIEAGQCAWLEAVLRDSAGPALIGLHHPPFRTGMPRYDEAPFPGADALMRLLARHAARVRLVAGHTHRPIQGLVDGIAVSTAPPLGYTLALALVPDAPHAHTPEAPAMQIHQIDTRGAITHTLPLAPRAAPQAVTGMLDDQGRARIIAP
ncbi:MAG: metallophosphoesterase [Salinarimonas sp.]